MSKEKLERSIKATKTIIAQYEADLAKDEKQLAELEKPKLKNGDIWYDGEITMFLKEWNGNKRDCVVDCKGDLITDYNLNYKGQPIIANLKDIFDDLANLSSPLEEFRLENKPYTAIKCNWHLGQSLHISHDSSLVIINKEDLPEFILNLRRLVATARGKK